MKENLIRISLDAIIASSGAAYVFLVFSSAKRSDIVEFAVSPENPPNTFIFVNDFTEFVRNGKVNFSLLLHSNTFKRGLTNYSLTLKICDHLCERDGGSYFVLLFFNVASPPNAKAISSIKPQYSVLCSLLNKGGGDYLPAPLIQQQPAQPVRSSQSIAFTATPDWKSVQLYAANIHELHTTDDQKLISDPYKLLEMLADSERKSFSEFLTRIESGTASVTEYSLTTSLGDRIFLRHFAFPIQEQGVVKRIHGLIENITEEKRRYFLLQRSEEQLRTLFETADDLIFRLNAQGSFISINNNGALSLEYLPDELAGKHFIDLVHDQEKQKVGKSLKDLLKSKQLITFEVPLVSKFGNKIVFEINAKSVFDGQKFESLLGIGRNISSHITDRERLSELNTKLIEANRIISIERDRIKQHISVLEELNKMKSEFVSSISHEFRTPLASIIGFSETIDSDHDMEEPVRKEFNALILQEAKKLAHLINGVLDLSHMEAGQLLPEKTTFDLVQLIRDIAQRFQKEIEKKALNLSLELPPVSISVHADRARIEQAIAIVVENSVKHTDPEGRVSIQLQKFMKEAEIIISDTGIGIPKHDIPQIFDKFYRVSRPYSSNEGPGLGLALAKQIIDLHKGLINLQSEEFKGTTVIIKLPTTKQTFTESENK